MRIACVIAPALFSMSWIGCGRSLVDGTIGGHSIDAAEAIAWEELVDGSEGSYFFMLSSKAGLCDETAVTVAEVIILDPPNNPMNDWTLPHTIALSPSSAFDGLYRKLDAHCMVA